LSTVYSEEQENNVDDLKTEVTENCWEAESTEATLEAADADSMIDSRAYAEEVTVDVLIVTLEAEPLVDTMESKNSFEAVQSKVSIIS
jgi:hypothetical protein